MPVEKFGVDNFPQVRSAKANLDLAEKELVRAQKLLESGDLSRSVTTSESLSETHSRVSTRTHEIAAVVAQRAVDSADAQVAAARELLSGPRRHRSIRHRKGVNDTAILSPISGYVSERVADPGEYISPSAPNAKIATIVRTSPLRLRIDVPEQSIGKVSRRPGNFAAD